MKKDVIIRPSGGESFSEGIPPKLIISETKIATYTQKNWFWLILVWLITLAAPFVGFITNSLSTTWNVVISLIISIIVFIIGTNAIVKHVLKTITYK